MDVIICHQFGFRNVVAPLGTSLTAGHLQKLRKLTGDAVVVFDGDAAGIAAARRAVPLLCRNDIRARILLLPRGEDPDSYLRKHGIEPFSIMIEQARSMIDFLLGISEGRKSETVREALAAIAEMSDTIEAEQMILELAGLTRIHETTLRDEFKKVRSRKAGVPAAPAPTRQGTAKNAEELLLLSAVIAFPEKTKDVISKIDLKDVRDEVVASLFRRIASAPGKGSLAAVLDGATEEERLLFTRLSVDPGFDTELADRVIGDCFRKIEKKRFEERLHQARAAGDIHQINALLVEKKRYLKDKGT
jgi:DNA primase